MTTNAKKGLLKKATTKVAKSGNEFVSLLINEDWYSLFNSWWFGGNESPYDIREYANTDEPKEVVFVSTKTKAGYLQCTQIRPADEKWQPEDKYEPADQLKKETVEPYEGPLHPPEEDTPSTGEPSIGTPPSKLSSGKKEGLALIAEAQELMSQAFGKLVDGTVLVVREEAKDA